MAYTIIRDDQEQIRYLYGARPFAELLTRDELEQVERGELVGVSERGAVLALSSPLEEGASVTLRAPDSSLDLALLGVPANLRGDLVGVADALEIRRLERARELTIRWHWSHVYERVEKARRDGVIGCEPLEQPTFGIDEAGREELRAWVSRWLAEYIEASTAPLRQLLTASQFSTYMETPIETRERGGIIYSLDVVLRLEDMSAALELLREATGFA
jgi:hypothetical protein